MRLIGTFPMRSGVALKTLELKDPKNDYPAIRAATENLMSGNHVQDILRATYARMFVDEYQDCIVEQHNMISKIAETLPTCVLGDDMQAIFGWGTNVLVDWKGVVEHRFPSAGELTTPWRWKNVGCLALGNWLLEIREALKNGVSIDLRNSPAEVQWVQISGANDMKTIISATNNKPPVDAGNVLIVCDSKKPPRHREIASRTFGAVVVENADLSDFVKFAEGFNFQSIDAVDKLIEFGGSILTGVGAAQLKQRVQSLTLGTARNPPNSVEQSALSFKTNPCSVAAVDLLVEMNKQPGVHGLRPVLFRACVEAFNACPKPEEFYEMAVRSREKSRVMGRLLPRRAVGSTLLLKGLEADVAVVVDTDELEARDLYVAMTRGARRLLVCSQNPILTRAPA
jgi:DNA helicase-2/ATP-dependent DNA helicase PcrA